jgi:hypothetical protein
MEDRAASLLGLDPVDGPAEGHEDVADALAKSFAPADAPLARGLRSQALHPEVDLA